MARIGAAIGIAAEGVAISIALAGLAIALVVIGLHALGLFVLVFGIAIAMFFRDPERFPARTEGVVISGADGKVTDVSEVEMPGAPGAKYRRVSVFMSPLNVHVNRAPVAGEVAMVEHTPGQFVAAYRDDASTHNERNLIIFRDAAGRRHGIMQIAGYLARRIVCRVHPHDQIEMGQRVGLIMFGSRVDHFIPPDYRVSVAVGERVLAGETVIGELAQ